MITKHKLASFNYRDRPTVKCATPPQVCCPCSSLQDKTQRDIAMLWSYR